MNNERDLRSRVKELEKEIAEMKKKQEDAEWEEKVKNSRSSDLPFNPVSAAMFFGMMGDN